MGSLIFCIISCEVLGLITNLVESTRYEVFNVATLKTFVKKFEEELYNLVRNIGFKRIKTGKNKNKDTNVINKNLLLFIPADKTNSNF